MTEKTEMVFGGGSVAENYDNVLVPIMFDPWAEMLLETLKPEPTWDVLDLATGTGIVARKIAARLGEGGSITGADMSPDMLAVAKARLAAVKSAGVVNFVETPAHPLDLGDAAFDAVYCQQGFQFFPDQDAAAAEMYRVLRPGGRVAASAWCPLAQCEFFGQIAECMKQIGEEQAAGMMARPFDHLPEDALRDHFAQAGFKNITIETPARDLVFERGPVQAFETIQATPIAPLMETIGEEKKAEFRRLFDAVSEKRTTNGVTRGPMVSLVLTAEKAG